MEIWQTFSIKVIFHTSFVDEVDKEDKLFHQIAHKINQLK